MIDTIHTHLHRFQLFHHKYIYFIIFIIFYHNYFLNCYLTILHSKYIFFHLNIILQTMIQLNTVVHKFIMAKLFDSLTDLEG